MIDLKIRYSDTITILESEDYGFMMRLWIVMSEKGIGVRNFRKSIIEMDGLLPMNSLKDIINEQFNSELINIVIL